MKFRHAALLAFILASSAQAAPNTTNLRDFQARYTGTTNIVVAGRDRYAGDANIRASVVARRGVRFGIVGNVKNTDIVTPITNTLVFTASGLVRGKRLTPGLASGSPFKGTYTATRHLITFVAFTRSNGYGRARVSGVASISKQGRLVLRYSVFFAGVPRAVYIYRYTALTSQPSR